MEELDPIIRDFGVGAINSRPQESCSCTSHTHTLKYRNMGLLLILTLVLLLASQQILIWPNILPQILAITVSASFAFSEKRKRNK